MKKEEFEYLPKCRLCGRFLPDSVMIKKAGKRPGCRFCFPQEIEGGDWGDFQNEKNGLFPGGDYEKA